MRRRAGVCFLLSVLLPAAGVVIALTRIADRLSRPFAFALWALGWVALLLALRWHAPAARGVSAARGRLASAWRSHGRLLVHALLLAGAGAVLFTLVPADRVEFVDVPRALLEERIDADLDATTRFAARLEQVSTEYGPLFEAQGDVIAAEQKGRLLGAWLEYLDLAIGLDRMIELHKYFWQINPLHHRDLNARSFLVGYAALVAQTGALALLERSIGDKRALETLLNDPRPELGIAPGTYQRLKWRLTDPQTLLRLNAGRLHLQYLRASGALDAEAEATLADRARQGYLRLWKVLGREPELFGDNPLEYLESKAFVAWFPVQKAIAQGMGRLRTTRRDNFVTVAMLREVASELRPGDILLERRNWYATNVGLPGFWPHAALYVGTPGEMDAFFSEPESRQATAGLSPSDYLHAELPDVDAAFRERDAEGHTPRVLEAIAPGVTLTSLEHSGNADYLAVLRPNLPKAARLAALVRAFGFHRRPYDFEFDFVTDRALVCSELVYKAYAQGPGKPGLQFSLAKVGGRQVLPPNDIARSFDEQPEAAAQLSLVLFLDGNEAQHRAIRRDAAAFRETWRRPKWDFLQQ